MKHWLTIAFFLCFFLTASAQTTRYVYDTYVNPDTINLVTMKGEKTFLDVKGNLSVFSGAAQIKKDSLALNLKTNTAKIEEEKKKKKPKKEHDGQNFAPKSAETFFNYYVLKNIPSQEVQYVETVFNKDVFYTEDRKPNWKISDETRKIGNYDAQKAETTFGGRIWTAWFTTAIPVSDGPYKFSGLPGLIVKLEDSKGDYRFELEKIISIPNGFEKSISPQAKKSSRAMFQSDKASVQLSLAKEMQKSDDSFGNDGPGRNGPPGEMGGMPPGNGMGPPGEMSENGDFPNPTHSKPIKNNIQNPIELKP